MANADVLAGMNQFSAQLKSEASDDSGEIDRYSDGKQQEEKKWKQPRPIYDGWPEEAKNAREHTATLHENLLQRAESMKAGVTTTRQDYMLRTGTSQLKLTLCSLDERVYHYQELMRHEETDWKKVFIRDSTCTPALFNLRVQELSEIKLTAEPVIELIETGVTNVKHLINKTRGAAATTASDANAASGNQMYKPHLTDEDDVDLESRDNKELVQMQQKHIEGQDRYLDQISVIGQVLKHQNEDFRREVREQNKMLENLNE